MPFMPWLVARSTMKTQVPTRGKRKNTRWTKIKETMVLCQRRQAAVTCTQGASLLECKNTSRFIKSDRVILMIAEIMVAHITIMFIIISRSNSLIIHTVKSKPFTNSLVIHLYKFMYSLYLRMSIDLIPLFLGTIFIVHSLLQPLYPYL